MSKVTYKSLKIDKYLFITFELFEIVEIVKKATEAMNILLKNNLQHCSDQ